MYAILGHFFDGSLQPDIGGHQHLKQASSELEVNGFPPLPMHQGQVEVGS